MNQKIRLLTAWSELETVLLPFVKYHTPTISREAMFALNVTAGHGSSSRESHIAALRTGHIGITGDSHCWDFTEEGREPARDLVMEAFHR